MTYQRDLKKLIVSLDSLTNGQASVTVDEENVCKFTLTIIPSDGPYRNGKFDFEISFDEPSCYPADLPQVICTTPIYHPNIDNDEYDGTNVCLSLFDEWDSNSLADIVQGLLFLFYNPNLEDPLSSLFDGSETQDEFTERIRMSLTGELEIDGTTFTRNQVTNENSRSPADSNTINTPCDTSDVQETNNTPHANTNDDDLLETNIENSSHNNTTQKTSDSNVTHELENTMQFNDQISTLTTKTPEHTTNEAKILHKQDSLCATIVNSELSSPAVVGCPTLDQTKHQTWNAIVRTVMILIYVGFVSCDQHFYEILR